MRLLPDWRRALARAWSCVRARLIPDVERVLKRAWSLRFIELAAAVDIILNTVPSMDFLPWWLTLLLLGGAWTARLIWQPDPAEKD